MDHPFWTDFFVYAAAGAVFGIVLLAVVIWSIRRHHDPKLAIESDAPIDKLIHSLAGLSLSTVVPGNSVNVLENGAFFDVLLQRIASAQHSVHFETFLWKDGVLGQRLAEALCERARAHKQVRVMLDAVGSKEVGSAVVQRMRDAGCRVEFFHGWAIRHLGVMNDRDHRKLCVIDGREAFVGGHCIVDNWLGDAQDHQHYSDLSVHLHGPIVNSVQAAFSENWTGKTGEVFVGDDVFPALQPAGEVSIHAAYLKPEGFGAGGEAAAPHCDLHGAQMHPHPEPVFQSRARGDRCIRAGGGARGGRAGDDALYRRLGQPDGAARWAPQLREAAALRSASVRVPAHPTAPEGDDDRRRVERHRFEQLR